jgi:hypothetical protein
MAVFTVIKKVGPGVITAIPQRIATLSNIIENFMIDIPCQYLRGKVWIKVWKVYSEIAFPYILHSDQPYRIHTEKVKQ